MKPLFEKVQKIVDKAIPYLLVILISIVIIDVFYHETAMKYQTIIDVLDGIIIVFFIIDLIFKYIRVKNIPRFLRLYWLDILAVFPFFLLLRLFEEVLLVSERSAITLRNLFHAGLVLEEDVLVAEEAQKIARTSELLAKEGRIGLLSRFFKPLERTPRLFKAISFYEHPSKKKTEYHKKSNIV